MAITDMVGSGTNIISSIADGIIFWKNWSGFSKMLSLIVVLLLFFGYMLIKNGIRGIIR